MPITLLLQNYLCFLIMDYDNFLLKEFIYLQHLTQLQYYHYHPQHIHCLTKSFLFHYLRDQLIYISYTQFNHFNFTKFCYVSIILVFVIYYMLITLQQYYLHCFINLVYGMFHYLEFHLFMLITQLLYYLIYQWYYHLLSRYLELLNLSLIKLFILFHNHH